jgi:hypothetical protein
MRTFLVKLNGVEKEIEVKADVVNKTESGDLVFYQDNEVYDDVLCALFNNDCDQYWVYVVEKEN